ncbi:MAG: hypothetical protein V1911_00885 [Candidatus Micrarchaeota archaeon]
MGFLERRREAQEARKKRTMGQNTSNRAKNFFKREAPVKKKNVFSRLADLLRGKKASAEEKKAKKVENIPGVKFNETTRNIRQNQAEAEKLAKNRTEEMARREIMIKARLESREAPAIVARAAKSVEEKYLRDMSEKERPVFNFVRGEMIKNPVTGFGAIGGIMIKESEKKQKECPKDALNFAEDTYYKIRNEVAKLP